MVFSSSIFVFTFLPLVLILYYNPILKKRNTKNIILLIFSIAFYAYGEPIYVILMILSITVNWGLGLLLESKPKYAKSILAFAVIYNLGILFLFKYVNFVLENIGILLHKEFVMPKIILPIGISFYTFQALSYFIDVYNGTTKAKRSWVSIGLYVSCFPQLIAGPIVRYNTIAREIDERKENIGEFITGVCRFAFGLSKKVIIANNIAVVADAAFVDRPESVIMAWLGAIAYMLQIYYDFSGYSDMAIGLGMMFGFHFPENFNYPYIAKSVTEFWHRWHMSLTQWFRDYVYIPLGGNRVGVRRHIFNLCVVWLFTGIWHGANWTFILWGMIYLLIQLLEKYTGFCKKMGWFGHVYTLLVVLLCWVIFRADSVSNAISFIGNMFGIGVKKFIDGKAVHYFMNYFWYYLFGMLFSIPVFHKIQNTCGRVMWVRRICQICFSVLFVITVGFILGGEYDPFIYFNF